LYCVETILFYIYIRTRNVHILGKRPGEMAFQISQVNLFKNKNIEDLATSAESNLKQVLLSDATVSSQKYSASSPDDGKAKTTFEMSFY
jgi:hypothetical protein